MKTIAVVPVKSLHQAKSRLAGVLLPEERASLTLDMLRHVLDSLAHSGVIADVGVISPDPEVPHLPPGVIRVEQSNRGLNPGLEEGRVWALKRGADALLVIFADLPQVTPEEIARLVELGKSSNTVVLASDRHGAGTNAMLAHPAPLARFAFGRGSFARHLHLHEQADTRIEVYRSEGIALDIDTPDDLLLFERAHAMPMGYGVSIGDSMSDGR